MKKAPFIQNEQLEQVDTFPYLRSWLQKMANVRQNSTPG